MTTNSTRENNISTLQDNMERKDSFGNLSYTAYDSFINFRELQGLFSRPCASGGRGRYVSTDLSVNFFRRGG